MLRYARSTKVTEDGSAQPEAAVRQAPCQQLAPNWYKESKPEAQPLS